eukprot:TRINITY_DN4368_c0_g1_i3.p1 TRINITY_DN4368_c0_g1~~TRINITY_DN4368_c0_g1_i3.p1  ORF type:complete len:272 (-),score=51.45 TRINITY_DN4368_c0_g1_i3:672-1487(-)
MAPLGSLLLLCTGLWAAAGFSHASVLVDTTLPMDTKSFLRYLSSPHLQKDFLTKSQNLESVSVSPWVGHKEAQQQEQGEVWWSDEQANSLQRRHLSYVASLKTWMGQITTETTKIQELLANQPSQHQDMTMVIYRESDTATGIPTVNSLLITTHWQVSPDPSGGCRVRVDADVDLRVPRHIAPIAGRIEKTVLNQARDYVENMLQHMVEESKTPDPTSTTTSTSSPAAPPSPAKEIAHLRAQEAGTAVAGLRNLTTLGRRGVSRLLRVRMC